MNTPALTTGVAPARQSGNVAYNRMLVLFWTSLALLIGMAIWAIQVQTAKKKRIGEKRAVMENLYTAQLNGLNLIEGILNQSEKFGGLFLPLGLIYPEDGSGVEREMLIACVIRKEARGWDPDEFVSVFLNNDGQVVIRRIGSEMKSWVRAAQRNNKKIGSEVISGYLKRCGSEFGPALKRYLKAHLEASNRRPDFRTGGLSLTYSQ